MPFVNTNTRFEPGDVPTAAQLNAPYDQLATVSAGLNGENTATGWITWRHGEAGSTGNPVANQCFQYANPTTSETLYNSTSYTTITQGGNPAQITLNITPEIGEVMRFAGSGMVGEHDITTDYDYAGLPGGNKGKPNFYAFRLLLNHTTAGVPGTINLGEWGYSFTTKKDGTLTNSNNSAPEGQINWQAFAFSTLYRQTTVRTLNSVELQVKVFDTNNDVSIERHQLYAIRHKR